jgi:hypothetical protein
MPEKMSAICARLKPFLQKIGVSSSPNNSKVPRTYRTGQRSFWDETPSRMMMACFNCERLFSFPYQRTW